jgi:hypothetical protein
VFVNIFTDPQALPSTSRLIEAKVNSPVNTSVIDVCRYLPEGVVLKEMPNHYVGDPKTGSMNYCSSVRQGLILGHKVDHLSAHYFRPVPSQESNRGS